MDTSFLAGLIFFIAFASMIILHELGHFFAARFFGIEVEEFGFGIPPKMLTLFRWKGTDFTLNWIPLGGFVRPKGENDPNVVGGLAAATPWRRLGVLVAGPAMNLITALFLFIFLVHADGYHDFKSVQLAAIAPNSPAEQAGMQVGDILVSIDGQAITGSDSVRQNINNNLGKPVEFVLLRDGEEITVTATPRANPPEGQGAVGIAMGHAIIPMNSWGQSVQYGARSVVDQTRELLLLPARMIKGTLAPGEGRFIGLKGISDIFNLTVSSDVESRAPDASSESQPPTFATLYLIAALTISIGIFNLFPFPALDGGRIIFVIPEILFGRRVPQQFENTVHAAGMAFLLLLMLYVNIMDFVNPLQLVP